MLAGLIQRISPIPGMRVTYGIITDRQGVVTERIGNVLGSAPRRIGSDLSLAPAEELSADQIQQINLHHYYFSDAHFEINHGRVAFIALPSCQKSIHYWTRLPDGGFAFSDNAFVLASLLGQVTFDSRAFEHFSVRNVTLPGETYFHELKVLKSNAVYVFSETDGLKEVRTPHPDLPYERDEEAYADFKRLLLGTVRSEMEAGGQAGLMFSGGIDSTLLGCVLQHLDIPFEAVTLVTSPTNGDFETDYQRSLQMAGRRGWKLHVAELDFDSISADELSPYCLSMPFAVHISLGYERLLQKMSALGVGTGFCGQNLDTLYSLGATERMRPAISAAAAWIRRLTFSRSFLGSLGDVRETRGLERAATRLLAELGCFAYSRLKHERFRLPSTSQELLAQYRRSRDELVFVPVEADAQDGSSGEVSSFEVFQRMLDHKITEYLRGGVNLVPHLAASRHGVKAVLPYGSEMLLRFFARNSLSMKDVFRPKRFVYDYYRELAGEPFPVMGRIQMPKEKDVPVQQWYFRLLNQSRFGETLRQRVSHFKPAAGLTPAQEFNSTLCEFWCAHVLATLRSIGVNVIEKRVS